MTFFNSAAMRLLAPAKINLHLRVGPRREDGFHPLLSWMTRVGLFDNLELQQSSPPRKSESLGMGAGAGGNDGLVGAAFPVAPVTLDCDMPGLPTDERNLVVRIAKSFREEVRSASGGLRIGGASGDMPDSISRTQRRPDNRSVQITLRKRIPVGAGLGGGSSDAARTLLGLNQLWETGWAADDLSAFAARFGSDLSFFCYGPSSVCRGRGEIVMPIRPPKPKWAVLVLPALSMPTADVYRTFDQMRLGRDEDIDNEPDWTQWTQLSSVELLPQLVNDLEKPSFAISPALGDLRQSIERLLGRVVRMSGSGSSLFTLFDEQSEATNASIQIGQPLQVNAVAVEVCPAIEDDLNEPAMIR